MNEWYVIELRDGSFVGNPESNGGVPLEHAKLFESSFDAYRAITENMWIGKAGGVSMTRRFALRKSEQVAAREAE